MTPPEPRSSQVEPPSARSPPSSPVLCALSLSSVTFPAHPKPELPADKSFHAGRHNHPTEPHVNFPLPFWFTYFFSAKTNTNKREPTDSKWVCVTVPASPSWSLWPSHDSPQKATFPLGHPEMLHSAENQDERAGMGRYFYPFQKKKRERKREGGVCVRKRTGRCRADSGRRREKLRYLHAWGRERTRLAWNVCPSGVASCWWLVAQLLRHQLTVPCLCLFVTKDTVLPTYK